MRDGKSQEELEAVSRAEEIVRTCAKEVWPGCTVRAFGSQANQSSLPGSDVDLTILGVQDSPGASGLSK